MNGKEQMDIEDLVVAISNSRVRITDHADEEALDDQLKFDEIYFSVIHGEIIEDYPNDKPYPNCLIMGKNLQASQFIVCGPIMRTMNGP